MEQGIKNKVIVLALSVLLVLFVSMFLLNVIWTSDNKTQNLSSTSKVDSNSDKQVTKIEEKVFGKVYSVNDGNNKMLSEYYAKVFRALASNDKDVIYELTSSDYIKEYNLNKDSLYEKLKSKGLVGKVFECKKYSVADNQRFGKIYSLEISSVDGKTIDDIIIIEEKPRSIKISFDSYVGEKKQDISITKNGLKMSIASVKEYKNVTYFDVVLQNTTEQDLVINKDRNCSEAVCVVLSKNTHIYNTSTFFNSDEIVLKPGEKISTKLEFFISDLQSYKINKLVLINVYSKTSQKKENYEYSIYN